jgi:hypothetical protein
MANLKSIIKKHLCSKFKVSYFFNLVLLLSLSSCTSEDLDQVLWVTLFLGVIWNIILPLTIVYAVLFLFHVLRFLYYTHKLNQNREENALASGSMDEVVSITAAHEVEKRNAPLLLYFIMGLIPFLVCALYLLIASWEHDPIIWLFAFGAEGILFAIMVLHLGGTYLLSITINGPSRLLVRKMTIGLKPKELLRVLQTNKAFSNYTVKALKNELILQPSKFNYGRLIVIQCVSKIEEKYTYKVEASVRPINNTGFMMNQKIMDLIINLENK